MKLKKKFTILDLFIVCVIMATLAKYFPSHTCQPPTIPHVQQLLIDEGYDLGESGADGVCGDKTAKAWTEWSQATIEHENYLKCK